MKISTSFSFHLNQAALDGLLRSSGGPVGQLVAATGRKAQSRARGAAPVATGALAGSISVRDGRGPGGEPQSEVVAAAPHWRYVEFGTRYMRPQPFLRSALRGLSL